MRFFLEQPNRGGDLKGNDSDDYDIEKLDRQKHNNSQQTVPPSAVARLKLI